ncbi:unnamed protein product [Adineta ricciae]|uniref:Uncharacterized protein n=1 Tax=Adineta ricciae TaxID=249248 RepID=A0A815LY77_ADIRI|nr:unnamed protein product [Adineta ricciae]CAF1608138.1 unnamed protein product [Adineta ricciae]
MRNSEKEARERYVRFSTISCKLRAENGQELIGYFLCKSGGKEPAETDSDFNGSSRRNDRPGIGSNQQDYVDYQLNMAGKTTTHQPAILPGYEAATADEGVDVGPRFNRFGLIIFNLTDSQAIKIGVPPGFSGKVSISQIFFTWDCTLRIPVVPMKLC